MQVSFIKKDDYTIGDLRNRRIKGGGKDKKTKVEEEAEKKKSACATE